MGNSHYKSNICKDRSESAVNITGFDSIASINSITATNFIINTLASAPTVNGTDKVIAGSYIKVGTGRYIRFTTSAAASTISRQMYDNCGTPYRGSITLGVSGVWLHKNNFANSSATAVAISSVA